MDSRKQPDQTHPSKVKIVEVGARDGLQNEAASISADTKVSLINQLSATGLPSIEAGALVSPKWVPQMAHSDDVYQRIDQFDEISYPMLVPNEQGLDRALRINVKEIAIFAAASESFSHKNINRSIAQSLESYQKVTRRALDAGVRVRGYVSCVAGCPYEGEVSVGTVADVGLALADMGCYEVSFGDTTGVGTPQSIKSMLRAVFDRGMPVERVGIHCHDTYGMAIANIHVALMMGVAVIDSSVAGLGGCPYAPGASGNVATEDVLYLLQGLGIETGVDLDAVVQVGQFITDALGIHTRSKAGAAIVAGKGKDS